MSTISEQILTLQEKIGPQRDLLINATKAFETDPTPEVEQAMEEHRIELEKLNLSVIKLQNVEKTLGLNADPANDDKHDIKKLPKAKDTENLLGKMALCVYESRIKSLPLDAVRLQRFGDSEALETILKAAQNPAMSNVPGYAQELTQIAYGQFMDLLREEALLPKATPLMKQHQFNGATSIYVPMRAGSLTDAAGAFRAEGAPIPVKGIQFTSQSLTPKSLGVILTATEEMLARSSIDLAAYFQSAMVKDTAEYLDIVFLSPDAGSAIIPAGIRNGLIAGDTRASSGGTTANIVTDIKVMMTHMAESKMGNPATTRWIMSPKNWFTASMALTATGALQFPETSGGKLGMYSALVTTHIPDNIILLVDFDHISAGFGAPNFLASSVATLHEENTTPLPIATAGSPNVVAAPVRSLYQTNSWALRLLMDVDWKKLRTFGMVQELTAVAWVG